MEINNSGQSGYPINNVNAQADMAKEREQSRQEVVSSEDSARTRNQDQYDKQQGEVGQPISAKAKDREMELGDWKQDVGQDQSSDVTQTNERLGNNIDVLV